MQLSPIFNLPAFTDANGNPLAGAKIYQYEAGSFSVLKATYTTSDGTIANANPIVLNSAGQLPSGINIWLTDNEPYNFVLTDQFDTVLKSFDDVTGIMVPVASTSTTTEVTVWVPVTGATYLSATSFLVSGNNTSVFAPGNRVRLTLSTGFTYGVVSSSTFSSPNTSVTIINDGVVLNSSLSVAEYSVLIANDETVDAGGVSYTTALAYSTSGTVGNKLKSLDTDIATTNVRIDALRKVWTTSGTGTYTITLSPSAVSYSEDMAFTIKFANANTGAATLNVNGLGAKNIKVLDASGAKTNPTITANLVSEVAYDGTDFILLDVLPPAATSATPRGKQTFTSNGTFTVPSSVYYIKVTCVGGGGGGGLGNSTIDSAGEAPVTIPYTGGGGGGGAVAWDYITTAPGTSYAVSVGSGGTAATALTAGTNGGSSSFGVTTVTASGGTVGGNASTANNGAGGAGGGTSGSGNVLIRGANGFHGSALSNAFGVGTNGGGGGWAPGWGAPSREWGGGGNGGINNEGVGTGTPGTNGFQGIVVVEW